MNFRDDAARLRDILTARCAPFASDRRTLDRAYKAARKEKWRRQLTAEWASLDGEGWPSVVFRFRLGRGRS